MILVLLSTPIGRVSVSRIRDFWMAPLRFLPNLRHVDKFKSIWGLCFPVESHKTFCGHSGLYNPSFELLSRNSWVAEVYVFIATNLHLSSGDPKVLFLFFLPSVQKCMVLTYFAYSAAMALLCAVISFTCAVCSVQMQCAVSSVQYRDAGCSVPCAVCSVQCIVCKF